MEDNLWLAVFQQALRDSIKKVHGEPHAQRRARSWFREADEDFLCVCSNAGLDPECARSFALNIMRVAEHSPEALPYFLLNNRTFDAAT